VIKRVTKRALPLLVVVAVSGCGGGSTTTTTAAAPMTVTVFRVHAGKLRAEAAHVPRTHAVAAAALGALPVDADVSVAGGTAHVDAHEDLTAAQIAEVVYTLTQFPSIGRVRIGTRTLTRADVEPFAPPILIESPLPGARLTEPVVVRGTASVFEATLVVELRQDGNVVAKQTVTASTGAPERGTFHTSVAGVHAGPATIVAYAPSAANGEPQHLVRVPVTL
jgi:hypothetical protein